MKPRDILICIVLVIAAVLIASNLPSCTEPQKATRILQQQGYTEIRMTGYRYWMAGEGDWYSTGFEAIAPNGDRVTGAVTSGPLKGATVRFD